MKTKNILAILLLVVTGIALLLAIQNFNLTVDPAVEYAGGQLRDEIDGGVLPTLAVLPTAVPTWSDAESTELDIGSVLLGLQTANVISVEIGDLAQRVVVTFQTGQDRELSHREMTAILCAAREYMPEGYGLMLGGKLQNSMTVVTAVVSDTKVAEADCSIPINWPTWADEYSG